MRFGETRIQSRVSGLYRRCDCPHSSCNSTSALVLVLIGSGSICRDARVGTAALGRPVERSSTDLFAPGKLSHHPLSISLAPSAAEQMYTAGLIPIARS